MFCLANQDVVKYLKAITIGIPVFYTQFLYLFEKAMICYDRTRKY